MPYREVLENRDGRTAEREVCVDNDTFADLLATALRNHPASPPSEPPALTTVLQGNLTEFAVWDLGERHWFLYERHMTWPANADSPWKGSSSDGVDILALAGRSDLALLVIEVKSSDGCGANLVTGSGSTLQSDFDRLFSGAVQDRILISVGKALASLRYMYRRPDLEEQVKAMVGPTPAECSSVQLIGVLMCNCGDDSDEQTRDRAFSRLADRLNSAGWRREQLRFQTVEVASVIGLLTRAIEEVTG